MKEKCPRCGTEIETPGKVQYVNVPGYKDEDALSRLDNGTEQARVDFDRLPAGVKQIVGEFISDWVGEAGYKRLAQLFYNYVKHNE